jgi:hypothetical protein
MTRLFLFVFSVAIPFTGFAQQKGDPKATEVWQPVPKIVVPPSATQPAPTDAVVLFDGTNTNAWRGKNGTVEWTVEDGALTVAPGKGDIFTLDSFESFQLHIEWRAPKVVKGSGQARGNSGVFLQGKYEIQILDSYDNPTYANGQAASVYKQHIPLVNACRPPGEWQTYDIIYKAPVFDQDKLVAPAYVSVLHNGILVQNHVAILGETVYIGTPVYKPHGKGPIKLQDHGDLVSFRNIWLRPL